MRQSPRTAAYDGGKGGFADLKWIEPKVITIKLNQVKRPHENALVILPISDAVE
jgi:hypothetical protein